jgi:hypothetical protein
VASSRRSRPAAPPPLTPTHGPARAARARRGGSGRRLAGVALGLTALTLGAACAPQPRVPAPPVAAGGAVPAAVPRATRAAPPPERAIAPAEGDVVEAAQTYVQAIYDGDYETAAIYQPGFGPKLHEDEDTYTLLGLSARPISWSEFGYPDAAPDLEIAEVVARVQSRKGPEAGNVYYKLGFRRVGDTLTIDQASKRTDLR